MKEGIVIKLETENGAIAFENFEELTTWLRQQQAQFDWLRALTKNNLHTIHRFLYENYNEFIRRSGELNKLQKTGKELDSLVVSLKDQFSSYIESKKIITSASTLISYVDSLKETNPKLAASVLVAFLDFHQVNLDTFSEGREGQYLAYGFKYGKVENAAAEKKALKEIKTKWEKLFDRQLEEQKELIQLNETQLRNAIAVSEDKITTLLERTSNSCSDILGAADSHKAEYDAMLKDFKADQDKALNEGTVELENITRAYDEGMALKASVLYWKKQEQYQKVMAVGFGIATIVAVVVVICGLLAFSNMYLDTSFAETKLSKLLGAGVLTTFGVWAVRTCANIFMSHMHLRTDARERRTMLYTYLALIRKGHGPAESERQLILQTLFRPSTTGLIRDDAGPSNLVDVVNKMTLRPGSNRS